jgi:predicted SnoaL-like aldol condensation-catalyzing enzyme
MSNSSPERNKAIVLEAFETLFNKRDYVAAERFWSPNYIQHSAHISTRSRRTVQSRPLSAGDVAL